MPSWSESLALLTGLRAARRLNGGRLVAAALAGWVLAVTVPALTAPVWPYEPDGAPLSPGGPAIGAATPLELTLGAPSPPNADGTASRPQPCATFLDRGVVLRDGPRSTTLTRADYALLFRALLAVGGLGLTGLTWPLLVLAVRMLRRARSTAATFRVVTPMMMQAALPGAVAAVVVGLLSPLAGHADGTRLAAALCLGMMAANSVLVACAPAANPSPP